MRNMVHLGHAGQRPDTQKAGRGHHAEDLDGNQAREESQALDRDGVLPLRWQNPRGESVTVWIESVVTRDDNTQNVLVVVCAPCSNNAARCCTRAEGGHAQPAE